MPPFQGWFRALRLTQGFALGFAMPPFQGWIRVFADPGLRPGLCYAALSGLDFGVRLIPGLRPGLCYAALSGLIWIRRPRASPWALLCRPFRAGSGHSPDPRAYALGFAMPPFQGWFGFARSQGFALGFAMPPFQGWIVGLSPCPRASPWALLCRPFRADLGDSPDPGLTPWAMLCRPFRAGLSGLPRVPGFTPGALLRRPFRAEKGTFRFSWMNIQPAVASWKSGMSPFRLPGNLERSPGVRQHILEVLLLPVGTRGEPSNGPRP